MSDNIDALAADWLEAKREENAARDRRLAMESQLAEALEVPDEGSKTHRLTDHKVTLTQPVTRKVDPDAWGSVEKLCPVAMQPIKWKLEADASGCKWLANNEPEIWRKIAPAFETKPGKVGVKVEVA